MAFGLSYDRLGHSLGGGPTERRIIQCDPVRVGHGPNISWRQVYEDERGEVWTAYTDFDWIACRHGIENRQDQFKMATNVITSITSSVKTQ